MNLVIHSKLTKCSCHGYVGKPGPTRSKLHAKGHGTMEYGQAQCPGSVEVRV
jgi:hypothetical protein